ncbi:putative sulfate exporter family transporter [Rubrivirga sp. S365]|uniref:YeiH family protein n=1 Tax=Rubrivirga sp. S365 TaxID=3076080 RepID=UPI0028C955A6|nr:putative sulfate exporter family transporter [Rubrivirga sp. S365]MDT7857376.1 putative sulfate exporter family transporter [Rubrivirga sp. S365]
MSAPSVPAAEPFDAVLPPEPAPAPPAWHRALFLALAAAALLPVVSPAVALGAGAILGLTLGNPFEAVSARVSKLLLKACVVGLGFGMSLPAVLAVGKDGVGVTALGIAFALSVGLLLGRLLHVEQTTGALISGGTAICGGSAIAALGPALGAGAEAMGVSLATVFLLNGVALYVFPAVGHLLDMSQHQFALWAAIAIHDTSSVVGAAASYGAEALAEATVLKLTRALWIVPLALGAALWHRKTAGGAVKVSIPWFIGLFALASAVVAVFPAGAPLYSVLVALAKQGLVLTLFLIGAGLSRATLRAVGVRPLVQGVLLWVAVGGASLAAILAWVP